MPQIWFTADTHFGHANIIKFCNRPFLSQEELEKVASDPRGNWKVSRNTVEKHDAALLNAINESVMPDDTFWVLGDFCWGKEKEAAEYLDRIHCKNVHFVWGNHDHSSVGPLFQSAMSQGIIRVEGQLIWLNHYPMRSWDGRFHGSWHLYGHVHNRFSEEDALAPHMLTRDVGMDACDYRPISFAQLSAYMKPRIAVFEELRDRIRNGETTKLTID